MNSIIFMGTPEFAVPSLKAIQASENQVKLLVCQPDKKKGRGQNYQESPTKKHALKNGIQVFQPPTIKDEIEVESFLKKFDADFFVVIAYGKILPKNLLELPKRGCINVHASILPKWRGAAPIQFALLHGDTTTGATTMLMDEGLDTGDILLHETQIIDSKDDSLSLTDKLAHLSARIIIKTLETFNNIIPIPQENSKATYSKMIFKENGRVNWNQSCITIFNQYRALMSKPGIFTTFRGKRLLLKNISFFKSDAPQQKKTGRTVQIESGLIQVACQDGLINIHECQAENKKSMSAKDFINGYQVKIGEDI